MAKATNPGCLVLQQLLKDSRTRTRAIPHHQVARKSLRQISVSACARGGVPETKRARTSECSIPGWVRHLFARSLFPTLHARNKGICRRPAKANTSDHRGCPVSPVLSTSVPSPDFTLGPAHCSPPSPGKWPCDITEEQGTMARPDDSSCCLCGAISSFWNVFLSS